MRHWKIIGGIIALVGGGALQVSGFTSLPLAIGLVVVCLGLFIWSAFPKIKGVIKRCDIVSTDSKQNLAIIKEDKLEIEILESTMQPIYPEVRTMPPTIIVKVILRPNRRMVLSWVKLNVPSDNELQDLEGSIQNVKLPSCLETPVAYIIEFPIKFHISDDRFVSQWYIKEGLKNGQGERTEGNLIIMADGKNWSSPSFEIVTPISKQPTSRKEDSQH